MKNNKILYLLTILITLFSFNMKANAAQEFSCVYNSQKNYGTVILSQNKTGNLSLFWNKKEFAEDIKAPKEILNADGWKKLSAENIKFELSIPENVFEEDKTMLVCPEYSIIENDNSSLTRSGIIKFYDANQPGGASFIKSKYVINEKISTIIPSHYEISTLGSTCEYLNNSNEIWIKNFENNNFDASCLYAFDTGDGCHVIQLNISMVGKIEILQKEPLEHSQYNTQMTIGDSVTLETIKSTYNGWCPNQIYVKRNVDTLIEDNVNTNIGFQYLDGITYDKIRADGVNLNDTNLKQTNNFVSNYSNLSILGDIKDTISCSDLFGDEDGKKILNLLKSIVTLVKIAIPILLIGLGIIDFAKAIFSGTEDNMKKIQAKFIKRIIIAVCIFLVPTVLKFVLTLANGIWSNISTDFCGILQ